jgi:hypothetical protein
MSKKEKFDWCDYYHLGKSYKNEDDAAKLRTGVDRFYFSSFLKSRDYLLDNRIFLGKESKEIMTSESSEVHKETRNIFEKHPQLNTSNKGKQIARELDDLRHYRNLVDYDAEKPENIRYVYNYCESRAKIIFKLLEELN